MIVAAHQPYFLPYMGFFNKINNADIFVYLDDVKDTRGSFSNRNKVKSPQGEQWFTVPVTTKNIRIDLVEIVWYENWMGHHLDILEHLYSKAKYYSEYIELIDFTYDYAKWKYLSKLNEAMLFWIFIKLKLFPEVYHSSDLNIKTTKSQRLIDICKKVGGDTYLSGLGAKEYVDVDLFKKEGIEVIFQDYQQPKYKQRFGEFVPNLSVIDALFNCGEEKVREMIK